MQKIDIEKIMQEIRADIQKKGYTADMLSFTDVPMRSKECLANQAGDVYSGLADLPRRMRERSRINWKRPVPAKDLSKKSFINVLDSWLRRLRKNRQLTINWRLYLLKTYVWKSKKRKKGCMQWKNGSRRWNGGSCHWSRK